MLRLSTEVTWSSQISLAFDAQGCTGPVALETYEQLSHEASLVSGFWVLTWTREPLPKPVRRPGLDAVTSRAPRAPSQC